MKTINNKLIDKEIATYIYSGIITDTGSFRYPLTTAETHNITSELFKKESIIQKYMKIFMITFPLKELTLAVAPKNLKKLTI